MKLSIIIPIYNVAHTLERCLLSLPDSLPDVEIILVDDGATDDSGIIADTWAVSKSRCRVIHQSNKGLSEARNAGINVAIGEYITFVDSDDFVSEGLYEQLLELLEKHPEYDLLEYSVQKVLFGGQRQSLLLSNHTYTSWQEYWIAGQAYLHAYAWNKISKRQLWTDIRFPKGRFFEDVYLLPLLAAKAKLIATTSIGNYYYCENPQGITHMALANEWHDLLQAHLGIYQQLRELSILKENPRYRTSYQEELLNIQLRDYLLSGYRPISLGFRLDLHYSHFKFKAVILNCLGIHYLCFIVKTVYEIKKRTRLLHQRASFHAVKRP